MNLAEAAPNVEKAEAEPAPRGSAAKIDRVTQTEPARASTAPRVDPAKPFDNPRDYAPPSVVNAATISMQQAQQKLSVETLRLNAPNGRLDFEGYAAVIQGAPQKNAFRNCLPCVFDERDFVAYGEVKYYVTVLQEACFVYAEETSEKPYYAIQLTDYVVVQEDRNNPDPQSYTISPEPNTNKQRPSMITILLKTKKDQKQAYQFTFETMDDKSLAKRFMDVVQQAAAKEKVDVVVEGVVDKDDKATTGKSG